MTTTFDGLRNIIVRDFELPPERLTRDTPLEQIELDSLAVTELVFALEDEFHVTAGSGNLAFKTLGDIADYIDKLIVERDAPKSARPASAVPPVAKKKKATVGASKKTAVGRAPPEGPKRDRRGAGSSRRRERAR